jgi:hypothetical protein
MHIQIARRWQAKPFDTGPNTVKPDMPGRYFEQTGAIPFRTPH